MKIVLIGNPNSGKTTLFNVLTGMNAKVGNWPGVTIEKKVGIIKGTNHELVDLPGIYSLSPYSIEEEISRKFVFDEKPDVIINIIDSTSLERSLYLTTQLLELDTRIIVALNMTDILKKRGIEIDIEKLKNELKTDVIKISALKEIGIEELISVLIKNKTKYDVKKYDDTIDNNLLKIEKNLDSKLLHKKFVSVKLLEEDKRFNMYENDEIKSIVNSIRLKYDMDLEEVIATQRYNYIDALIVIVLKRRIMKEDISDKLDKIFLNKWSAFPIFIAIMVGVYYLSVGVIGSYTVELISLLFEKVGIWTEGVLVTLGASEWLISLIVNGVIAGVGSVLNFVPQLIILFVCISVLETTGYMSRISLLLDNLFRKIGLSGKSLIPFIVGSGCSVPGIMGSRIIENQDERKITAILTPFIPCGAKLPIIALFAGHFFENNAGIVSVSLYFFAVFIIILSAYIMKKRAFKKTSSTYIFELPDYKIPSIKYVFKDVLDKVTAFIKRAGSVVLICSIGIWFLLSFSLDLEYGVSVEDSILASFGKKISWVFYPMLGENSWGAAVSAIQGLVAKEQVVSSMAVIAGFAEDIEEEYSIFESGEFCFFTAASAYAFMVFNLFSAPCFGAIGAMKKELGSIKSLLKAVTFQTLFAWMLAVIVYQIGSRLETGIIHLTDLVIIVSILGIIIVKLVKIDKNKECIGCPYCVECDKTILFKG